MPWEAERFKPKREPKPRAQTGRVLPGRRGVSFPAKKAPKFELAPTPREERVKRERVEQERQRWVAEDYNPLEPKHRKRLARDLTPKRRSDLTKRAAPRRGPDEIKGDVRVAGFAMPSTLLSRAARDAQDMATGLPGGVYAIGKSAALDVRDNPALAAGILPGIALAKARDKPVAPRTTRIGKGIAKQYAEDYRHPIRHLREHPGFVGMDVAAAFSGGAGAASRIGAARSAVRQSGKLSSALTRPAHEGGSLLNRPLPEPRTHYFEGQPIQGRYSQNPGAAAIQKWGDKRTRARAKQTGAKLSTISGRKAARLLDEERRIKTAAEQAPALRVAARARKHKPLEQIAVDAVAVGLPIDEHVRALRGLAAQTKGKARKRLSRRAELLEQSRRYLDESGGKPQIADDFPDLQDTVGMARAALDRTERDLERAGLLSSGGAATRRNAPGRVLLGAEFTPKSLAELEGPQFNLIGKRVRSSDGMRGAIVDVVGDEAKVRLWRKGNAVVSIPLDELYAASGRFREGRLVGGGRAVNVEKPIDAEKARARASQLQEKVDAVEQRVARDLMERNPDKYPSRGYAIQPSGPKKETRRVHEGDKGSFRHYRRRSQDPTVQGDVVEQTNFGHARRGKSGRELALEDAQKMLSERARAEGAHPLYRAYAAASDELADLKTRLDIEQDVSAGFLTDKSRLRLLYERYARHPKVVDTDEVRLLIPAYRNASIEERAGLAAKYHEQASRGKDRLWRELLDDEPERGKVAFMAGGSGAGKSSTGLDPNLYDGVLDTTFSSAERAIPRIEEALETGRDVDVHYVYRDPAEAFAQGVLSEGRLGKDGRVVSIDEHARMHVGAREAIDAIQAKYGDNKRVNIYAYVNRAGKDAEPVKVDSLPRLDYDEVRNAVAKAYEQEAGRLTEAQRKAASPDGRGIAADRRGGGAADRGGSEQALPLLQEELDDFPLFGTETVGAGSVPFTGGEFYLPEFRRSKPPKAGMLGWRGGIPRKPGTLTNSYTGALRRAGSNTPEPLRALAENLVEKQRYLDAERHRQRILPMGHKARPADTRTVKYAPVRTAPPTRKSADMMRRAMQETDFGALTPDDASRLDSLLAQFRESLFPEREYATVPPGTEVPGIAWVDSRLIANQRKIIGSLGPLDTVQDAAKGLILYAKPGYVTPNVLGNAGMNVIQQGFLAPANWRRAVKMGDELGYQVDALMGHGFAAALGSGTKSPITKGVTAAADFWSKFVDIPFRRAAWSHEARRQGFKGKAAQQALIEDPRYAGKLAEITQRARDAIVDYERMGAVERDVIRRILFVYPWVKGSTYYAVQFFRDHPVQAAVFAAIAQEGNRRSTEELGPMPAWARGSFKVFEKDGKPYVVNPAAISPFSTPASVLATARGGFGQVERSENIGEMTAPVFQAGVEAAFGRDLFTGRELEGGYGERFAKQLGKGLPQATLYRRLTEEPKEGAAYPYGRLSAIGQFVLGSSSPRPVNVQTLNEQAAGGIDPERRIRRENIAERQAVMTALRQKAPALLRENPGLEKRIGQAYSRKLSVDLMRREVEQEIKEPGLEREREKLRRETALLRSWGVLSPKKAAEIMGTARNGSIDDVKGWRDALREEGFETEYLALLREARETAGVER